MFNRIVSAMEVVNAAVNTKIKTAKINVTSKELNFAYSFRPIYYFSRIFGLMPFTITYYPNGRVKGARVNSIDGIWLVISINVYLISAAFSYQTMKVWVDQSAPVLVFYFGYLIQIIRLFFGGFIIALDLFNRFKLVGILKKLSIFDRKVSEV